MGFGFGGPLGGGGAPYADENDPLGGSTELEGFGAAEGTGSTGAGGDADAEGTAEGTVGDMSGAVGGAASSSVGGAP